ncbi:MAG: hypothetical protein ABEN55_16135, partial [Bradymonadaceae bacterium]
LIPEFLPVEFDLTEQNGGVLVEVGPTEEGG